MKSKTLWHSLLVTPALFGTTLLTATNVVASETFNAEVLKQIQNYNSPDFSSTEDTMGQVNSVTQFRDVSPNDWAYEALRGLVERYGCIAGYPNGTFRGNRALTRYEFAAGLYSCLTQIERLIATSTADFITRDDLVTLERLVQEFEAELATLGTRVDNLETRLGFLEENQFSTTTTLSGEAVIALTSVLAGEDAMGDDLDDATVLGHRTRVELNTSFFGEDLLYTRLATGNFPDYSEAVAPANIPLAFSQPDDNDVALEVLFYRFPVTNSTEVFIAATGGAADDFADTLNILDGDGALGALSAFGTRNPIYYPVEGAGAAVIQQLGNNFELSVGYLASEADNPSPGSGIFAGPYGALGQLVFKPSDNFNLGLTYIHLLDRVFEADSISRIADLGGFIADDLGVELPSESDSYGLELSWRLSNNFVLGGWVGYTNTSVTENVFTGVGTISEGDLDVWNWAVTLGFPDLGKEGNLGGIILGMPPKVTNASLIIPGQTIEDDDTTFHIEAFYQYQVTDGIFITPGVIWQINPNHNENNADVVIGTLRTTFTF